MQLSRAQSAIEPDLIAAYKATEYLVNGAPPFGLQVGSQCQELLALYKKSRVDCCAFISACNPFSEQLDPAVNIDRQAGVVHEVQGRGLSFIAGIGQHPSNNWPGEPSFLVLGLSMEAAKPMGRKHGQNAIVWCGPDALPRLVLLR